ncbi:hypothetical protein TTHERM_00037290 (macronuclear) [Tetrahymena thermophila SB210]|uniref:Uncharacterized protein n=1 Tax=Tetrahymena thermophila (strain SB210) TaxID=312017 RepID=Q22M90_TETTS|nr:hypothetical protein TTHERM_00037290 [Tetrahymena thermophila SB210]EAR86663.1 hypothetical protein TTHERM_00037290 [Tetrahymena thermophila SB210]|eukprot:XP_977130.1 hypothetical protein TTHERM_00037290 [Tetrahymena thermophila SB210]
MKSSSLSSIQQPKKELLRNNSQNKKNSGILSQRNQSFKDSSISRETQQSSYYGDEYQKLFDTIQRLEVENNEKDLAIEKATQIIDVLSKDLENATNELQKLDQNRQELKDKLKQLEIENNDLNQLIEKLRSEDASLQTASFENEPQNLNYNSGNYLSQTNNLLNLSGINKSGHPNSTLQLGNNSITQSDKFYNEEKVKINQMIDEYEQIIDELNQKNNDLEQRLQQSYIQIQNANNQLNEKQNQFAEEQLKWKKENENLRDRAEKLKKLLQQNKVHLRSYQISVTTPLSKSRIRSGFYANNDYLLSKRNERSLMEQSKSDISISEIGTDDQNNTCRNGSDNHSFLQSTQKFNSPIFRIREEAENEEETSSCRNSKQSSLNSSKKRGKSQQNSRRSMEISNQKRSSSLNSSKQSLKGYPQQQINHADQENIQQYYLGKDPNQFSQNNYAKQQLQKSPQDIERNQNQNIKVFDEGQAYSNRDEEEDDEIGIQNNKIGDTQINLNQLASNNESRKMEHYINNSEPFFGNSPNPFDSVKFNSLQNSADKCQQQAMGQPLNNSNNKLEKACMNTTNPLQQEEDFEKFENEFQQELERREQQLYQQFEEILSRQVGEKNQELEELKSKIVELNQLINTLKVDLAEKEKALLNSNKDKEDYIDLYAKTSLENENILKQKYEQEIDSILNKLKQAEENLNSQSKLNNSLLEQKKQVDDQIEQLKGKLLIVEDSLQLANSKSQKLQEESKNSEQMNESLKNKLKHSEDALQIQKNQNQLLQDQKNELERKVEKQLQQIQILEEQKTNYQDLISEKNALIEQNCKTIQELSFSRDSQIKKIENQVIHFEKEFHQGLERREQQLWQQFEMNRQIGEKNNELEEAKKKVTQLEETVSQLKGEIKVKESLLKTTTSELQEKISSMLKSQVDNELAIKKRYEFEIDQIQSSIRKQDDSLLQQAKQNNYLQEKKSELEKKLEKQSKQIQVLEDQIHNYQILMNEKNIIIEQNIKQIAELTAQKDQQSKKMESQSAVFEKEYQHGIQSRENELKRDFEEILNRQIEEKNQEIFDKNQEIYEKNQQIDEKMQEIDDLQSKVRILEENNQILEREISIKEKMLKSSSDQLHGKISHMHKSSMENELNIIKQYQMEIEKIQNSHNQVEEYLQTQTKQNYLLSEQKAELEKKIEKMQKQVKQLEEQKSSYLELLSEKSTLLEKSTKEYSESINQSELFNRKIESQEQIIKSLEQRVTELLKQQDNIFLKIKAIVDSNQLNSAKLFDESQVDQLIHILDLAISRQKGLEKANSGANQSFGTVSSPQFTNYEQIKLLLKYLPNSLQHLFSAQEQALMDFNQETSQDAYSNKLIFNLQDYCHLIARNWVNFLKDLHSIFKNIENNVLDLQNAIDALKNFDIMGIMVVCYNQVATNFAYYQEKYDNLLIQSGSANPLQQTSSFNNPSNNAFTQQQNTGFGSNYSSGNQQSSQQNQSQTHQNNENQIEINSIRNAVKTAEKYTSKLEERVVRSNNFQQVLHDTKVIMQVLEENLQNTVQRFLNSCVELRSTPMTNKKYLYSSFNSLLIEHAQDEMINIRNALKLLDLFYLNSLKVSRNVIKERGEKNNIVIAQIIKKISELTKKKQHLTALINQDIENLSIDKVINHLKDIYIYNQIPNIPLIHSNNTDKKHLLQNQIYELARENAGYKLAFNQIYMASTRLS